MYDDELDELDDLTWWLRAEARALRLERAARLGNTGADASEYKALALPDYRLDVKALDACTLEGYAATFGNLDLTKDIIEAGAFTATLAEARAFARTHSGAALWPLCWQHDKHEPIGAVVDARETSKGLLCTFRLDTDTERGRQAYNGLRYGYLSFSIGYRPTKYAWQGSVRHLTEIRLAEVSAVTFPANPEARPIAA